MTELVRATLSKAALLWAALLALVMAREAALLRAMLLKAA